MRISFFGLSGRGRVAVAGVMLLVGGVAAEILGGQQDASGASLPAVVVQSLEASQRGAAVNAGTEGQGLASPVVKGGVTLAILGDLAPTNEASAGYVSQAVRELNLLKPDAVLTVGNLVDGFTRSEERYAREAVGVHKALDELTMPWYPCAGDRDVVGMGAMYARYMGPRYYSLDAGDVHVIVLDSMDGEKGKAGIGAGIGAGQREWLKADLGRTFDLRRAGRVIVLVHRPLWVEAGERKESWEKVHGMLVEFNRKPVVSVEGPEGGGVVGTKAAKVVGVYAGERRAYAQDSAKDGIGYWRLGATAAVIEQDAKVMVRHYTLLKFDGGNAAPAMALVQLGSGGASGGILPGDVYMGNEREMLDRLMALDEKALGLEGNVEQPVGKEVGVKDQNGGMKLNLANPLEVPIEVEVRMASTANLSTATLRENANPYVENFDSAWELYVPYTSRHLEPGVKERWRASVYAKGQTGELAPPQVEFVVHWNDARKESRTHTVVLKRRVTVVPWAEVTVEKKVEMKGETGWLNAYRGGTYGWTPSVGERRERGAEWEMTADGQRVYVRVSVDGDEAPGFGGVGEEAPPRLMTDAVGVAWAGNREAKGESVQRIVVTPYAGEGKRMWMNGGVGSKQTALVAMDGKKLGVELNVETKKERGYVVTMGIPRKWMLTGEGCVMNVTAWDNDGEVETTERSWAKEEGGPGIWGKVVVKEKAKEPAATQGNPLEAVIEKFLPKK